MSDSNDRIGPKSKAILDKLEPEIKAHVLAFDEDSSVPVSQSASALMSIAISLKRIADIAELTNIYGEQGGALIARAITESLRRY